MMLFQVNFIRFVVRVLSACEATSILGHLCYFYCVRESNNPRRYIIS